MAAVAGVTLALVAVTVGLAAPAQALTGSKLVWGAPQPADAPHGGPFSVSCPTTTFCVAVDGEGSAVQYSGTTWGAPVTVDGANRLVSVSCSTTTFCLAVDSGGSAVTFNGTSWAAPVSSGASSTSAAVSCASPTFCVSVDRGGAAVTFNGATWSAPVQVNPSGQSTLSGVSCTSTTFCMTVDTDGKAFAFNGTGWGSGSAVLPPAPYVNGFDVSCASTSFCVAVGVGGWGAVFNGSSWAPAVQFNPDAADFGFAVSCASATFCLSEGAGAATFDGTSWATPAQPDTGSGSGVSCLTSSFCMIVDGGGRATSFDGSSWSSPALMDPYNEPGAMSCTSASFCMAVDLAGGAVAYNGSAWDPAQTIDAGRALTAVSCTSSTLCIALDNAGQYLRFNGTSWTAPAAVPSLAAAVAISCASPTFCVALDNQDAASTYDGSSWSAPLTIDDSSTTLQSVSCPTTTFCIAVDQAGSAMTFNGSSWTAPTSIDGTNALSAVSCASPALCAAVEYYGGGAVVFNGASWSPRTALTSDGLFGVSCTSASFCLAVGGDGIARQYNGNAWSPAGTAIAPSFGVLACSSEPFCQVWTGQYSTAGVLTGDATAPIVTLTQVPPAFGKSRSAEVDFSLDDADDDATALHATCKLDATVPVACDSNSYTVANLPDGTHTLVVQAFDAANNASATKAATWMVDNVAPSATLATLPAFTLASSIEPSWKGADARSGIANYDVRYEKAAYTGMFGAFVYPAAWQHTTALKLPLSGLAPGYDYCFSVRSRDRAGNVSAWSAVHCSARPLDDRALAASAGWTRPTSTAYYLHTYTTTTRLNVTLTHTGALVDRVTLVATTCTSCGKVGVYVNGSLFRTVNLYATATHRQVLINLPTFSLRKATITLKALTSGKTLQIDGLGLSRT